MKKTAQLRAFPRLHVTLVDLCGATRRRYGGAGFTLSGPSTDVRASLHQTNTLELPFEVYERDREDIETVLSCVSEQLGKCFRVVVEDCPPLHVGLGTKTALLLAIARVCSQAAEKAIPKNQLQSVTRRGAASGIGINAFFTGGFVVDIGHPASQSQTWLPSGASLPQSPPQLSVRSAVPDRWTFHLFLPDGKRYCAGEEVEMFGRNTPVPEGDVLAVLAEVYHGLVPAVLYDDIPLLKDVLRAINSKGFKRAEIASQPACVRATITALDQETEAAVGMSSMGPLVYAVTESSSSSIERLLASKGEALRACYLSGYSARNAGHEVLS